MQSCLISESLAISFIRVLFLSRCKFVNLFIFDCEWLQWGRKFSNFLLLLVLEILIFLRVSSFLFFPFFGLKLTFGGEGSYAFVFLLFGIFFVCKCLILMAGVWLNRYSSSAWWREGNVKNCGRNQGC